MKNINKSEKYKTEHDGAQKRHEHWQIQKAKHDQIQKTDCDRAQNRYENY